MDDVKDAPPASRRWPWIRFAVLLALWCVLIGIKPLDFVVGIPAAWLGAKASVSLMPGRGGLQASAAFIFLLRFLRQSLAAGLDVAQRAFSPLLPLHPGLVVFRPTLERGFRRDLFVTISSMMPGTLPVGSAGKDGIAVHCLDARQPAAVEMGRDEARFRRALGGGAGHG